MKRSPSVSSSDEKEELKTRLTISSRLDYVAGRFACKEAFIKASGNKKAVLTDISVIDDKDGKPHLFYRGKEYGEVSLAHDHYAVAIVSLPADGSF